MKLMGLVNSLLSTGTNLNKSSVNATIRIDAIASIIVCVPHLAKCRFSLGMLIY
jgi:hypothetical protein